MRKTTISLIVLLLVTVGAYAQVHRDGESKEVTGIDWLSAGGGAAAGLVAGYLLGSRRKQQA